MVVGTFGNIVWECPVLPGTTLRGGGMVGGFGGHVPTLGFEFAWPLPVLEVQTNNWAQL